MRSLCVRWALGALVGAALLGSGATRAGAAPTCGSPGKAPCPLQSFMRHELALPLAKGDFAALAAGFERVGRLNPEPRTWANWSKFSRDGARAAREGRKSGVIVTCARCHSVYRAEYNAKYRQRQIAE